LASAAPGLYLAPMNETPVIITPKPNGPLIVQGPVRIVTPDGREISPPPRKDGRVAEVVVLCRCGGSATKPFCDGSHKRIGFGDALASGPPPTA
jgi:CDGSH-type Zn-finger protein